MCAERITTGPGSNLRRLRAAAPRALGLVLLLWLGTGVPVLAEEVEGLYVAEVPVASQQPDEFRRAARLGMVEVLVRVSGDTAVADNGDIGRALAQPEAYYYQFSYVTRQAPAAVPDASAGLFLVLNFEPSAVAQLLRNAGFPVWGAIRPNLLVWLVVETGAGRTIVNDTSEAAAAEVLARRARARGLPLLLPLLDLEDKAQMSVTALWGGFHEEIETASRRYGADSILAGRIYQGIDGAWSAHWSVRVDGAWSDFDNLDLRLENLVSDAVDRVADRLAARYSITAARGSVWVEVEGVDTLEDYAELSGYLQNLAPVVELEVERVAGSDIRFRLGAEGTAEQLAQLIALDRKLQLLAQTREGERHVLHYRWLE